MKGRYGLYAEKSLVISPLAYLQRQSARSQHARRRVTCYQQTYQDLKATAEGAYAHASELLPKLEEARRVAQDAREPASEAERRWQEAHGQLSEVQSSAHAAIQELRAGSHTALGGPQAATAAALAHHTHHRLEAFKHALPNVTLWRRFPPSAFPLTWLPCASVHMEAVACTSDDAPYLIACISVGSAPLDDTLRSIALHWSVAEGPGAAWMGTIPRGWHTSPSVSQPCGARAWETALAAHAPVLSGNPASSAPVFSVVVQVPLEGALMVAAVQLQGHAPNVAPFMMPLGEIKNIL